MAEMFTGRPLFTGKDSIDQLARIVRVLGAPSSEDLAGMGQAGRRIKSSPPMQQAASKTENAFAGILPVWAPPEAHDLLSGLLCYNPSRRLTPGQALAHAFFRDSPIAAADGKSPISSANSLTGSNNNAPSLDPHSSASPSARLQMS